MKTHFSAIYLDGNTGNSRVFLPYLQQLKFNNLFRKLTSSSITKKGLFFFMLVTITLFPYNGQSQNVYPRDGNESLAMRLHDWYVESQKKLSALNAELPRAEKNAKQFINMPGDHEDLDRWNQIKADIKKQNEQIKKYETYWEKIRTTPPDPPRSFAMRYGPLSESLKPSSDAGYDQVEAAIRNFPFNTSIAEKNIQKPVLSMSFNFSFTQQLVQSYNDIHDTIKVDYQVSGNVEVYGTNRVESITQDPVTKLISVKLLQRGPYKFTFTCSFSNIQNQSLGKMYYPGSGYSFLPKFSGLKELKFCDEHFSNSPLRIDPSGTVTGKMDGDDSMFYVYGTYTYYEQWWYNGKIHEGKSGERTTNAPAYRIRINYNPDLSKW